MKIKISRFSFIAIFLIVIFFILKAILSVVIDLIIIAIMLIVAGFYIRKIKENKKE